MTGTFLQLRDDDLMGPTEGQSLFDILGVSATGRVVPTDTPSEVDDAANVLQCAFYEFLQRNGPSGTADEWHSTILHVANRWRRLSPHTDLLTYIDALAGGGAGAGAGGDQTSSEQHSFLLQSERDVLDRLTYESNPALIDAWRSEHDLNPSQPLAPG